MHDPGGPGPSTRCWPGRCLAGSRAGSGYGVGLQEMRKEKRNEKRREGKKSMHMKVIKCRRQSRRMGVEASLGAISRKEGLVPFLYFA